MPAPSHPQEDARLDRLRSYEIIDTPREHRFDRLVFMAAQIMKTPIAMVTFVEADRQWFKAGVGLSMRDTPRDVAFCNHTILQSGVFVVEDAREDPRFANNPLVTGAPHVRFYAGVPLMSFDGLPVGTLCVVDRQPRRVTPEQTRSLIALGREAEDLIYPVERSLAAAD
jgi:GAF domain-containing protein